MNNSCSHQTKNVQTVLTRPTKFSSESRFQIKPKCDNLAKNANKKLYMHETLIMGGIKIY